MTMAWEAVVARVCQARVCPACLQAPPACRDPCFLWPDGPGWDGTLLVVGRGGVDGNAACTREGTQRARPVIKVNININILQVCKTSRHEDDVHRLAAQMHPRYW